MTTERKARYITIAVLGTLILWLIGRQTGWRLPSVAAVLSPPVSAPPGEPRDTIYRMLDAARSGDAASYLDCFSGQMADLLRQSRSEMGTTGFTRYLTETNGQVKGITLSEPAAVTEGEVRVQMEYIYEDRTEAQQIHLEKTGRSWRITRIDSTELVPTLVPYGTAVK